MMVSLSAVGGVVYIGSQSQIRPVLVVMDQDHLPVGIYQPGKGLAVNDERVTKATLAQFIKTWRMVSIDARYQREQVDELEKYINNSSPAFTKMRDFIISDMTNPMVRGKKETVSIRISNVLPISERTWQINWHETSTPLQSGQPTTRRYQATLTFTFMEDVPAEILLTNPTGLLISDINWNESI